MNYPELIYIYILKNRMSKGISRPKKKNKKKFLLWIINPIQTTTTTKTTLIVKKGHMCDELIIYLLNK